MKLVYVLIASLMLASAALAQQKPPPDNGAPPPPPPEGRGGDRPDGPRGDRGPGPGRPDGPGRGDGPGMRMRPGPGMDDSPGFDGEDPRMARYNLMRGYLDAVDRYARLAHDPAMSGIAAVVTASDLLKKRGTDAGIKYFTELLPQVKSPAIGRAIRIQLVDLYKAAGKQEEALGQLKELMLAEPAADEGKNPPPPPHPPGR